MTPSMTKISLDIHDHASSVVVKAKKNDTGRLLYINLMDGRRPYVITNECLAVFTARKPDGNILFNKCSILGNTICYQFTEQTAPVVGRVECEVKLYGADDNLLTSASFAILVEDTVYDEGDQVESEKEVSALTKLLSDITTLIYNIKGKLARGELKGDKGDKGDIGPQGVSYVATKLPSGYFALEYDSATGDLYCIVEEDAQAPTFSMDADGNIYYEIKED